MRVTACLNVSQAFFVPLWFCCLFFWEFGRLLGVYVVFFFVLAQLISWAIFHQRPSIAVLIGGSFIIVGGVFHTILDGKGPQAW